MKTLEYAASFSSDQCVEGVVAVAGEAYENFTIERLGETFNETVIPLRYTPRKFVLQPKRKLLVMIESDQGAFAAEEREAAGKSVLRQLKQGKMELEVQTKWRNGGDDEDKDDPLSDEHYGYPKAESDKWVSCIRVLDPRTGNTTCLLELQENEACIQHMHYDGRSLELLHKTQVEGVPLALCQFQGRLLAGIGPVLRLYDLGKRRLLRKCENKLFPNTIVSINAYRDRSIRRSYWWKDQVGAGKLNGAPNKVEEIVQFHVGDVVTCLQKASLIPGGGECIVYGTVMGSVGAITCFYFTR
ncbi:WD40/YVTN repeat-like-containing domain superfamily [Sesbania bispinosa]|nr:WD40/YVTN repeat-like-containing domain superfamily [Sesbania bispinosa]